MEAKPSAVDVISVCSANGDIRPLRLQLADEDKQMIRINIEQAVKIKEIPYTGVEAHVFLCRGTMAGRPLQFELKYTFRSHTWCLLRRLS